MSCCGDKRPKIPVCPKTKIDTKALPPLKKRLGGNRGPGGKMGVFLSILKTSIIFGAGVYTGVYIAQNYQIDKVEDPKALVEKLTSFIKSKTEGGK